MPVWGCQKAQIIQKCGWSWQRATPCHKHKAGDEESGSISMQRTGGPCASMMPSQIKSSTKLGALSGGTRLLVTRAPSSRNPRLGLRLSPVCMSASPPLPDKPIVKEQLMTEKERSRKYRRTVSFDRPVLYHSLFTYSLLIMLWQFVRLVDLDRLTNMGMTRYA